MKVKIFAVLLFCFLSNFAAGKYNFPTPQMGWNSWNYFGCDVTEEDVKTTADLFVSLGLKDLGYEYVNVDDCWLSKERDADGRLQNDPETFPSGIKALADYVHSKGLKLGIYADAGRKTCAGRAGSLYHEEIDAQTFAEWEVDYLKYDNCFNDDLGMEDSFTRMSDALNKVDREIFFSLCNKGEEDVWKWGSKLGSSWRTTQDIEDYWLSMASNYFINSRYPEAAGPRKGWNDPDMLEIGNDGMTFIEYKAHFSLWALAKAPLLIGCDLTKMSDDTKTILMNREIIAINQDPLGEIAHCEYGCSGAGLQFWTSKLEDGYAIAAVNWGIYRQWAFTIDFSDLGIDGLYEVRDLWEHKDLGISGSYEASDGLEARDVIVLKLTPTGNTSSQFFLFSFFL